MIRKIVSNGRAGVATGALDAAKALDIPHCGWILPSEAVADHALLERYHLRKMKTKSPAKCADRNVKEADGTLMLTFTDDLTDDALCARKSADRHHIPWLHINLGRTGEFDAAQTIHEWLREQGVQTLYVVGTVRGEERKASQTASDLLEAVYYLGLIESNMTATSPPADPGRETAPESIDDIVSRISADMTLKDRVVVANLQEPQLELLHPTLGRYVLSRVEHWERRFAPDFTLSSLGEDGLDASKIDAAVIRRLWVHLRETHRLRVVK